MHGLVDDDDPLHDEAGSSSSTVLAVGAAAPPAPPPAKRQRTKGGGGGAATAATSPARGNPSRAARGKAAAGAAAPAPAAPAPLPATATTRGNVVPVSTIPLAKAAREIPSGEDEHLGWEQALALLEGQAVPRAMLPELWAAIGSQIEELRLPPGLRAPSGEPIQDRRLARAPATPAAAPAPAAAASPPAAAADASAAATTAAAPPPAAADGAAASEPPSPGMPAPPPLAPPPPPLPPPPLPPAGALSEADASELSWRRDLSEVLVRLQALGRGDHSLQFSELHAVLQGAFVGFFRRMEDATALRAMTRPALCLSNLAHRTVAVGRRMAGHLNSIFEGICVRAAKARGLLHAPVAAAVDLRRALNALLESRGEYEIMTKEAFNESIGQRRLWVAGEREELLERLCSRDGRQVTGRHCHYPPPPLSPPPPHLAHPSRCSGSPKTSSSSTRAKTTSTPAR